MRTDDYLADYARLGLQPGCSLETLERTWRLAVRDLHPDRAVEGLDPQARSRRLHEVTAAYRRLRGFEREHGRLPGGMCRTTAAAEEPHAPQAAKPDEVEGSRPTAVAPTRTPVGLGSLGMIALGGALAWSAWWSQKPSESELHQVVSTAPAASGLPLSAAAEATLRQRIRIGSTEAQVERLLGQPLVTQPDLWEYGPSHVRFVRGRVVGWYSSPLKPLPVDIESR
jgi:hypothetical protein